MRDHTETRVGEKCAVIERGKYRPRHRRRRSRDEYRRCEKRPVAGEKRRPRPRRDGRRAMHEPPVCVARIRREKGGARQPRPAVPCDEIDRDRCEQERGEKCERADRIDRRRVVGEQHGEHRDRLGPLSIGEPHDAAREREQQRTAEHRTLDDAEPLHEMRGVKSVVPRGQPARHQHAGVVAHFFPRLFQPRADAKQPSATQQKHRDFASRAMMEDPRLVCVVAEEDEARQQNDDAHADEPDRAELHLKRVFFHSRHRRAGRQNGERCQRRRLRARRCGNLHPPYDRSRDLRHLKRDGRTAPNNDGGRRHRRGLLLRHRVRFAPLDKLLHLARESRHFARDGCLSSTDGVEFGASYRVHGRRE